MSTLPNTCLSSTTLPVEHVKIRRPARARRDSAEGTTVEKVIPGGRAGRAWRFAERLDWRKPTTVKLRYVHGRDPGVEVRARGHVQIYPWDSAVLDILADVCNRREGRC